MNYAQWRNIAHFKPKKTAHCEFNLECPRFFEFLYRADEADGVKCDHSALY